MFNPRCKGWVIIDASNEKVVEKLKMRRFSIPIPVCLMCLEDFTYPDGICKSFLPKKVYIQKQIKSRFFPAKKVYIQNQIESHFSRPTFFLVNHLKERCFGAPIYWRVCDIST